MKYTVIWTDEAEVELAAIWVRSGDRDAIANAADFLESELAQDPVNLGESRPNGQRIAHALPLGIRFQIREQDRLVEVLAVWECQRLRQ